MDPAAVWLFLFFSSHTGATSALVTEAQCRAALLSTEGHAARCISPSGDTLYRTDLKKPIPLPPEATDELAEIIQKRLARERK